MAKDLPSAIDRPPTIDERVTDAAGKRLLRYTLPSLAVAGGAYALGMARSRFQDRHLFLPSRFPTGAWDPSVYGLEVEDRFFESEDGTGLHGWWIVRAKARATVLYCHGNSGSIADRIGIYRQLRRLRVNVFAFDYRGYGRSAGVPSEPGVMADVRAAHDHLTDELGVTPEQILLFGHSLGGAIAIDGAMHRPVAGLVVQSSFTDVRDMARYLYGGTPVHLLARNAFRSVDKVVELTMPKLFIHGTEDGTIPFAMGERLFEAAAAPKDWLPVRSAGHNDVHQYGGYRYFRRLSRFVKTSIG